MAQGKIEIQFQAKGDKTLVAAIKQLDMVTKRLKGTTSVYEKELKLLEKRQRNYNAQGMLGVKTNRLLGGSFATLRSKILLFSFGVGIAEQALLSFSKKSADVEELERGFNALIRTIGGSTQSLQKLEKATNNTVKQADLFKQANNAMMLGVVKTDDEMAELFDTAQRLGRALGRDTVDSIESLVTGMGRQSRLMLDNLGIIVKQEEAQERYAQKVGKTVSQLTDSEKKTAFNNEALRQATLIVNNLGKEQESTTDTIQSFEKSINDISIEIGEALVPVLNVAAKALKTIADNLDSKEIQKYAVSLGILTTGYTLYSVAVNRAAIATALFSKRNLGLAVILGGAAGLAKLLDKYTNLFEKLGISMDESSEHSEKYFKNMQKESEELQKKSQILKELQLRTEKFIDAEKIQLMQSGDLTAFAEKELTIKAKQLELNDKISPNYESWAK